ncbi:enolase C-terminal domain-like protein [Lentinula guzmanii]|uniref:Enolase C-terminal domain-like protein n=3 Tax=Lentinula TaxID=5352 RepID=A0AA38J722_9AGAR|nr:enolase C-terminal domain-like protein [Lentinula guzmanii]KAJ3751438.1 enolase C-terminal domain-like protein [Lentinula detonsa]KAJ3781196.1 enolase C-terminal domain-like protein [Lentinula aff. detonsa]KAJ3985291.1 enolase C-terminal domain-like protein [Lentinula detonsa]
MPKITGFEIHDVRFPTSLTGDGTDAMNTDCDYSSAYITLLTDSELVGHGMTFTIGRGNDIVCMAIREVANRLIGKETEDLFADMGKTWDFMMSDPQLRWIGPEKGVIHIATGSVNNALWDMYARSRQKPLWKLVVDFSPEELVRSAAWRYISDAITKEEALEMLKKLESSKAEREAKVRELGYPAYVTSAGWLGYSDEKVARLTKEAVAMGFNHFKMKVGADQANDLRRGKIIRSIIDDPQYLPAGTLPRDPNSEDLKDKNAGPTGSVLMIDANQVWDVPQAIEYVKGLEEIKPWFIEEPTAPDDVLGHSAIRKALKPHGIGVATGEHAHNRMVFKQLLQAEAIDVCQIDSCRLAGVSEVISVLLMSAKFGVPVCPHAGGVGLCEYVIHLSLIDYIAVSGTMERNVLEFVDHLHEHFVTPCSINSRGRYNVPTNPHEGYSIEMFQTSIAEYEWPNGSYWLSAKGKNV